MTGPRILLALHQTGTAEHLVLGLESLGLPAQVSRNMAATWVSVRNAPPDVVLLAPLSHDTTSPEFASLLEVAGRHDGPVLIVLTDDPEFLVGRLDTVNDFLPVDAPAERAARRVRFAIARRQAFARLHGERERLLQQAITDYKTGLFNDRYFAERSAAEVSRARRQGQPIGVLMIDFDGFKAINDVHGHAFGDHALATFAATLRARLRDFDVAARMGGDEFAVLLPGSRLTDSIGIAERLRATVAGLDLQSGGRRTALSVSIGVACWLPEENPPLEQVLAGADGALLAAKQAGRGRIGVAERGGVRTLGAGPTPAAGSAPGASAGGTSTFSSPVPAAPRP